MRKRLQTERMKPKKDKRIFYAETLASGHQCRIQVTILFFFQFSILFIFCFFWRIEGPELCSRTKVPMTNWRIQQVILCFITKSFKTSGKIGVIQSLTKIDLMLVSCDDLGLHLAVRLFTCFANGCQRLDPGDTTWREKIF